MVTLRQARDPLLHCLAETPFVVALWYVMGWRVAIAASLFWLGRETGQKSEGVSPWVSFTRPLRPWAHPQSMAEWVAPTLWAWVIVFILRWIL